MKVLFYITSFPGYGGIETVTTILSNWLSNHGVECSILSFWNRAPELVSKIDHKVKLFYTPDGDEGQRYVTNENRQFIIDLLNREKYDIIVYQDCYSAIHENLLDFLPSLKAKFVVVEHNTPICYLIGYKKYWKNLQWFNVHDLARKVLYPYKLYSIRRKLKLRHQELLNVCDKYVLLSNNFRSEINCLCGNKYDSKLLAIGNPVTLPIYNKNSLSKKKQILWLGRMTQDKGCNFISEIWKPIETKHPDWQIVIVGDGPELLKVKETFKKQDLHNVCFEGFQSEVSKYYEESPILIMTSLFEGYPLVLFEAMSRSCVPMAFNSFASISDIIDDKENGFVIKPYHVDEYVSLLLLLIEDDNIRIKMGKAAFQKSNSYNISIIGNQWISLFNDLTHRKK